MHSVSHTNSLGTVVNVEQFDSSYIAGFCTAVNHKFNLYVLFIK